MNDPASNAFIGRTAPPSESDLAEALGRAKPAWDRVVTDLAEECGVSTQEWRSHSVKAGWSLRLQRGTRTVVWLAPQKGAFLVVFIFGEKGVAAVRAAGLPAAVLKALDGATRYPEGTGLRLRIKAMKDVRIVKALATIKLSS